MSAPKTNMETEKRRHRGPLIGMIAVVAFALSLLFFLLMGTADEGTPVDSAEGVCCHYVCHLVSKGLAFSGIC